MIEWNDFRRNEPGEVVIYSLVDPMTNRIRYIGQTVNPDARYKQHITLTGKQHNPAKTRWIRTLASEGLAPTMRVMGIVRKEDADMIEMMVLVITTGHEHFTNLAWPTEKQIRRYIKRIREHVIWGPLFTERGIVS